MATDEEIDKFVTDNREMIERMIQVQKENIEMASEIGRDASKSTLETSIHAAEFARIKTEEFIKNTYGTITDPVVQRHFMSAGLEFLAGLTALADCIPSPEFMKGMATDFEKNLRQAACRMNQECPARTARVQVEEPENPE